MLFMSISQKKVTVTHILLELGVLFLGMDKVKDDVERAGEDEGEEETEAGEVRVALCAAQARLEASTYARGKSRTRTCARPCWSPPVRPVRLTRSTWRGPPPR